MPVASGRPSCFYIHFKLNKYLCFGVLQPLAVDWSVTRHRENLLRAEKSRIGRIYHSQQIEQNRKISRLCSDFNNKITKKISSAHKIEENMTENFNVHRKITR